MAQLAHLVQQCAGIESGAVAAETYQLVDYDGEEHEVAIPRLPESGLGYTYMHTSVHRDVFLTSLAGDHQVFRDSASSWPGPKIRSIAYTDFAIIEDAPYSRHNDIGHQLTDWDNDWDNSSAKLAITEIFKTCDDSTQQITEVIGIGLGSPGNTALMK
jgi:hypothetical protein